MGLRWTELEGLGGPSNSSRPRTREWLHTKTRLLQRMKARGRMPGEKAVQKREGDKMDNGQWAMVNGLRDTSSAVPVPRTTTVDGS